MVASSPVVRGAAPQREVDGSAGWFVVAATFVSTFTVFGVAYSFGSFFGPMADEFASDRSRTALVFSITTFLYFVIGMGTGRVADRIGPRRVMIFGAVCMVLGLLATSRVQSLWVGYITYGFGVGLGVACGYVPMVATVGGWFEKKRTTALGIAVAGIGTGTLVGAPLTERLVEAHGWRRTYVLLAAGCAVLFSFAAVGARRPPATAGAAPPPLWATIRSSRPFIFLYGSIVVMALVLFVPFVFMADYMEDQGVSGSAGWLVGSIGVSSVLGRIGLGALASRVPAMRLYQGSFLVLGLSFSIWLAAGTSWPLLLLFTIVMGIAYGGFIALSPAVIAQIFGPVGLGGLLGAAYTGAGVGGLLGPWLMGRLIDQSGYRTTLVVCTVLGFTSFLILMAVDSQRRSGAKG